MPQTVEVEGILIPLEWGDDGSVLSIGLNLTDERELSIVCDPGTRDRLLAHLRHRVLMSGVVDDRRKRIHPRSWRLPGTPASTGREEPV